MKWRKAASAEIRSWGCHPPAGVPSGFTIYAQVFVTDSGAEGGLAGSNGVVGTSP